MVSLEIQTRPRRYSKVSLPVSTWFLSLLVHAAVALALGCLTIASMAPAGGGAARSIELTLLGGFADSADETVTRVVFEAAERAPPLLEQPQLLPSPAEAVSTPMPIADPNVAPASFRAIESASTPPAQSTAQSTATQLFGIRGHGRRFVYVFDRSSSMEGRPLEAAKMQLALSLADLSPRDQFQVIFYNDQPLLAPVRRGHAKSLLPGDDASKRLALQFAGGIFAEGPTNHLAALAAALELKPDAIFFLTDASGETLRPDQLVYLRRLNRTATIHTIEFGTRPFVTGPIVTGPFGTGPLDTGPLSSQPSFLAQLALENGGQHAYIDLSRLR